VIMTKIRINYDDILEKSILTEISTCPNSLIHISDFFNTLLPNFNVVRPNIKDYNHDNM